MATIKISRGNDLLYETYANGEGNVTSLVSAIRTVQKESNAYLSKLVEEEKSSSNNTGKKSGDDNGEEENEDSEDDEDEGDKTATKKEESGKRRNSGKSSPSPKKCRSVQ